MNEHRIPLGVLSVSPPALENHTTNVLKLVESIVHGLSAQEQTHLLDIQVGSWSTPSVQSVKKAGKQVRGGHVTAFSLLVVVA